MLSTNCCVAKFSILLVFNYLHDHVQIAKFMLTGHPVPKGVKSVRQNNRKSFGVSQNCVY